MQLIVKFEFTTLAYEKKGGKIFENMMQNLEMLLIVIKGALSKQRCRIFGVRLWLHL